jgi:hypothetical protein
MRTNHGPKGSIINGILTAIGEWVLENLRIFSPLYECVLRFDAISIHRTTTERDLVHGNLLKFQAANIEFPRHQAIPMVIQVGNHHVALRDRHGFGSKQTGS